MRAEIVSIGTELLLGAITDTNASYLAQRLAALGVDCYYVSQVGDNIGRLVETLRRAWERSDLIITTGGLGPTGDDLTREAISTMLDERMEVDPNLESDLRAFFQRRGVDMPATNLKQAALIPSAQSLPNPVGTAPGWWVTQENSHGPRIIVAMPGVPYEMKRMWEHEVEPRLRSYSSTVIVSRTLKILGVGESAVEDKVKDLMTGSNPTLAPYAKPDGVHLRITAKADDALSAAPLIAGLEDEVRSRLGETIYGADNDTPWGVARLLLEQMGYSCVLLEIGSSVAGSLAPLLADDDDAPVLGVVSVASLDALTAVFGSAPTWTDQDGLQGAASGIRTLTHADVVLAVASEVTPIGLGGAAVTAEVEVLLLTPDSDETNRLTRVRQTWKTDILEVRRLAGLLGFNLLRLRLFKIRKQES